MGKAFFWHWKPIEKAVISQVPSSAWNDFFFSFKRLQFNKEKQWHVQYMTFWKPQKPTVASKWCKRTRDIHTNCTKTLLPHCSSSQSVGYLTFLFSVIKHRMAQPIHSLQRVMFTQLMFIELGTRNIKGHWPCALKKRAINLSNADERVESPWCWSSCSTMWKTLCI